MGFYCCIKVDQDIYQSFRDTYFQGNRDTFSEFIHHPEDYSPWPNLGFFTCPYNGYLYFGNLGGLDSIYDTLEYGKPIELNSLINELQNLYKSIFEIVNKLNVPSTDIQFIYMHT